MRGECLRDCRFDGGGVLKIERLQHVVKKQTRPRAGQKHRERIGLAFSFHRHSERVAIGRLLRAVGCQSGEARDHRRLRNRSVKNPRAQFLRRVVTRARQRHARVGIGINRRHADRAGGFEREFFHRLRDIVGCCDAEQMTERGHLDFPDRARVENAAVLRACDRDVEQPHRLLHLLAFPRIDGVGGCVFRSAQVEGHPLRFVVKKHIAPDAFDVDRAPKKRTEHDRILQPLALVNRRDEHRVPVAFEPDLELVGGLRIGSALPAKPGAERIRGEPVDGFLAVQKFGEVEKIREPPLAAGQPDEPLAHALIDQQPAEHRDESVARPAFVPVEKLFAPLLPRRVAGIEREDFRGVQSNQTRRQCRLQQWLAARLQHTVKKPLQFARLVRVENTLVGLHHTLDSRVAQRGLQLAGLEFRPHKHRDVAQPQRPAAEQRPARTQPRDVGNDRRADRIVRRSFSEDLPLVVFQNPKPQRWRGRGLDERLETRARLVGRVDFHVANLINQKRIVGGIEQRVDAVEQRFFRAEIRLQRVASRRRVRRAQIREHVRATESVNRLLRIADEQKVMPAASERPVEYLVLHAVGILKLVDQRRAITRAELARERLSVRAVERVAQPCEQVVVSQRIPPRLALRHLAPGERDELVREPVHETGRERSEVFAEIEERVPWRFAFRLRAADDVR